MANLKRRNVIKSFAYSITLASAFKTTNASINNVFKSEILVGRGGDFQNVKDALLSIHDNSKDNPYRILVLPGIYQMNFKAKSWVTIEGCGPLATIFVGSGWDSIQIGESNTFLKNFGIRFQTTHPNQAAIRRTTKAGAVFISNIHIEQNGPGAAIRNWGGDPKLTWYLRNLKIRSEGIGLDIGMTTYCHDLTVFLFGDNTGFPHIGVNVKNAYSRVYLFNCKIGTGYGYEMDENNDFMSNKVFGDDDVIGVWLQKGNAGTRVEIHGLESFCRNEDTSNPLVNVNILRIEDGWVRAFGCFGQAESPADWSVRSSIYQSGVGKLEHYACRFTGSKGNSFGSDTLGVQTFDSSKDGYHFDKYEGGLHRLDASNGSFTLYLKSPSFAAEGETHIFKKIDSSANSIIINLNGSQLEGSSENPILIFPYDTLKITWDGSEWVRT